MPLAGDGGIHPAVVGAVAKFFQKLGGGGSFPSGVEPEAKQGVQAGEGIYVFPLCLPHTP